MGNVVCIYRRERCIMSITLGSTFKYFKTTFPLSITLFLEPEGWEEPKLLKQLGISKKDSVPVLSCKMPLHHCYLGSMEMGKLIRVCSLHSLVLFQNVIWETLRCSSTRGSIVVRQESQKKKNLLTFLFFTAMKSLRNRKAFPQCIPACGE